MRAGVLDEPDRARGDAEGDEVLAEEADAEGRAVRSGSSLDSTAGIQYSRMRAPMGVPGPIRQSSSLSSRLSMGASSVAGSSRVPFGIYTMPPTSHTDHTRGRTR